LKDILTRLPTQRASHVGDFLPPRWQAGTPPGMGNCPRSIIPIHMMPLKIIEVQSGRYLEKMALCGLKIVMGEACWARQRYAVEF
jgi:hypothetical protein